ncbi:hypothetical protein OS493_000749 [Desmophyllum pertusum]|uniref:Uncharacterized protein n=1 Tax=Desmophyllum pertusum TaxID=174260 RepID=A0A9X0A7T8_9CNID|nr:hypothetical protein OS493_000749 [Desmophyllum pertusum]
MSHFCCTNPESITLPVQLLLAEFTQEAQERDHLMKTLLVFFETECANARADVEHVKLTKQQTETIVREMKICNLRVRSYQYVDVAELITPSMFTGNDSIDLDILVTRMSESEEFHKMPDDFDHDNFLKSLLPKEELQAIG